MDNEDEQYSFTEDVSFIEGALVTVWGLGSVIGGFVLMLYISSWFLKPDNYVPPKKEEIKVEQIMSTKTGNQTRGNSRGECNSFRRSYKTYYEI